MRKANLASRSAAVLVGAVCASLAVGAGAAPAVAAAHPPTIVTLTRGATFLGDVRRLRQVFPAKRERPQREDPPLLESPQGQSAPIGSGLSTGPLAPAPAPLASFAGLDFATWGAGHPPDTNGDVGPVYYIQTVNTSIGIFRKSDGARVAAFRFDTFMSQGHFGNLCDTDNFGDPVVLYDSFHDRWVITDFAFELDAQGNVVNPPGSFQCFAVSRNGDPVAGGWRFYSLHITDALQDYPKFGIWRDGLYMSANMFGFSAKGSFKNVRVWALDLAAMEAGASVRVVAFDLPQKIQGVYVFTLLPANARRQTGAPPAGAPNYLASVWGWTNRVRVWKFHVDWTTLANSTLTGPFDSTVPTTWASPPSTVPEKNGNSLDTLAMRLMMQNQYTNRGGVESLWDTHTVRGSTFSQSAVRWYQVHVTGGAVAASVTQGATWNPDSRNRFIPSLAVDQVGDMAIGYSVSDATMFPAIRYAGRLATDPLNTLGLSEASLIEGTGAQVGDCGGSPCHRWGDYSAMTLDPDGCTFWYTNEYYATSGLDDQTRIGKFRLGPSCTPDSTPPTVVAPTSSFVSPFGGSANSTTTTPIKTSWSASDPSGICSYILQRSVNGGTFASVALPSPTATAITQTLSAGKSYRYRVAAMDCAGNISGFTAGVAFTPALVDETSASVSYSGSWTSATDTSAFAGTLHVTTSAGASVTFSATSTRRIAFIAPQATNEGQVNLYVDGVFVKTVDLIASAAKPRQVIYQKAFGTLGAHSLRVENVATSGRPQIDADAFGSFQ
jgi:hypothetical protein